MKKLFLIILFLLFLLQYKLYSQWINVSNGMGNKQVYSMISNGNNLFAGTLNYGLYISTNNGLDWSQAGITLNNRVVFSLTIFANYLYAATDIGIWRTSNNGAYWSLIGLNNNTIYSLGANQSRAFAGTHLSGLYFSSGGTNWFISSLGVTSVKALAVNGDFILAGGGNNAGVHISTNNGTNWISTTLNNKSIYSLAYTGSYVYAGTGSGLYRSTDNGYIWSQSPLSNELIYSVAVYNNYVFAGSELNGVYLSSNNGLNWIQINEGLSNASIYSLYIFNNYIFAGASANSVYRRPLGELVNIHTNEIPVEMNLSQNYPNPFNPLTKIDFNISRKAYVTLKVYDVPGKLITTLVNKSLNPGSYSVNWNANQYQSGIYFYRLETGNFSDTKRMILIK